MFYFIVPITSQTVAGQTVNAPKYMQTDMAGLTFTCVPYGNNGIGIVSLKNANAALASESDVYAFPSDVNQPMADSDVATLQAFLQANSVPATLSSGMTFYGALQAIAQVFVTEQAAVGAALTAQQGNSKLGVATQQPSTPSFVGDVNLGTF